MHVHCHLSISVSSKRDSEVLKLFMISKIVFNHNSGSFSESKAGVSLELSIENDL